jgi:hypothetical protein
VTVLTESQTLERVKLQIKRDVGNASRQELFRLAELNTGVATLSSLSLGGQAATSHAFKRLAISSHSVKVPLTEDIELATLGANGTKTLLRQGSSTSAGAFQSIDDGPYSPTRRALTVLDLVRMGATEDAAVEFMRQTTYTSVAVETAEATSTTTGTAVEATLPFEKVTAPVESIDSWAPATRRALSDVDEMRGVVDDQLLHDARRRLEAQILAGDGASPNLLGLDNVSGVLSQAKSSDSVPLALAKGIAKVINAGWTPTAVVLNPDDWTDAIGPLLTAGWSSLGDILEVPVVKSAGVAAGTGYVGAWNQLAVWLRSTSVYVSDAHSDWFTKNLIAVMGEIRAAVGVLAPAAFCRVTGI